MLLDTSPELHVLGLERHFGEGGGEGGLARMMCTCGPHCRVELLKPSPCLCAVLHKGCALSSYAKHIARNAHMSQTITVRGGHAIMLVLVQAV